MRKQAKDMLSVFYQLGCNSDAGDHALINETKHNPYIEGCS